MLPSSPAHTVTISLAPNKRVQIEAGETLTATWNLTLAGVAVDPDPIRRARTRHSTRPRPWTRLHLGHLARFNKSLAGTRR